MLVIMISFSYLGRALADSSVPLVVRISQIESRILGVAGVLDVSDTKICGAAANYTLFTDTVPVLGTITEGGSD